MPIVDITSVPNGFNTEQIGVTVPSDDGTIVTCSQFVVRVASKRL